MRRKILHISMSLNIGGAETHILEVAKGIKSDYDVIVASSGGVYEKDLRESGISHYKVILDKKCPFIMLKSVFELVKIVKKEKVDLIHSHARIPSFIGGIVSSITSVPMVTTTHGQFKVNPLFRRLSNWGEYSIAISSDLKKYLINEYDYDEEKVILSVNGIDTNKFKADENIEKNKIVHVSRLDSETSKVAEMLIKNAEHIFEKTGLKIKIVGSGTEFANLKTLADKYDDKSEYVDLIGASDEVEKELCEAKIFIGVSRSLLEAMSYNTPVILAGDVGHAGIVTKENAFSFVSTNFSGREERILDEKRLIQDIIAASELKSSDWSRKFIEENYSIKAMVKPYLKLYKDFFAVRKKYVISGYYGYNNSGDDALLSTVYRDIREINKDNEVVILTKEGHDYNFKNVSFVNRFNIFKTMKSIRKSDVLVMGGGSLLQDRTSNRSLYYYLLIIYLGSVFKKKIYLYSNGIGSIKKGFNTWLTKNIVNKVNIITFRDRESYEYMKWIGLDKPKLILTADSVFSMEYTPKIKERQKRVAFIVREWTGRSEYSTKLASFADYLNDKYGLESVFVPLKVPQDIEIIKLVQSKMKSKSSLIILDEHREVIDYLSESYLVISMRFHGLIYSSIAGTISLGLSYDKKVDSICKMLDAPCQKVEDFNIESYKNSVDDILSDYDENRTKLLNRVGFLKEKAKINKEIFYRL